MSDQGYYVSEAEQIRLLRARLETAEKALQRIAEYETDWTQGPAANVNALQAIAESALGQGQGKEPIITGSSLEPTCRAQPGEAATGACTCADLLEAAVKDGMKALLRGPCRQHGFNAIVRSAASAAPPDPVPGACLPECAMVDEGYGGPAVNHHRNGCPNGPATQLVRKYPNIFGAPEPARPPLEPPCCEGLSAECVAAGRCCRPPEVPTCASWCGTKTTCHNGRTCWHVYGLCWCSESCHSLGHPRHPAPREGR